MRYRTALLLLCAGCAPTAPEVYVTAAGDEMIAVPAGSFRMGSESGDADEQPVHEVALGGFLIDRYEVRQSMFERLELSNGFTLLHKQTQLQDDELLFCGAAAFDEILQELGIPPAVQVRLQKQLPRPACLCC